VANPVLVEVDMLRIVHPAPVGQGTATPKRRRGQSPCLSLTVEETRHFRVSLRNVARAYGGFPVLAQVVGVPVETLYKALRRRPSGALALRVAKAAGMHVETLLFGELSSAGRCSSCGSRVGDKPERRAS
jgi:hypothetical protein